MGKTVKSTLCAVCLCILWMGLACAHGANTVTVNRLVTSSTSWNGTALPAYPEGTPEITILRIVIPPEGTVPLHTHPVINAGVLLKGELTVVTREDEVLHLKAGEPMIEVVNTWHYGVNEGDGPAEIVIFYAGIVSTPITIKESRKK